jgi:hypothetical protein
LGKGGETPDAPHPANDGLCDCSGFACWALGAARERNRNSDSRFGAFGEEWINTDSIVRDATGKRALFERTDEAQAGDLIVYPHSEKESYGHVGVITEARYGFPLRVAHCCARVGLPNAIIEEDVKIFWMGAIRERNAIFARFKLAESEDESEKVTVEVNGERYEGRFDAERNTNLIPITALRGLLPEGAVITWHGKEAPKRLEIVTAKIR